MTSLAFIFGVLPMAISSGAGSGGQHAVGTGVMGNDLRHHSGDLLRATVLCAGTPSFPSEATPGISNKKATCQRVAFSTF